MGLNPGLLDHWWTAINKSFFSGETEFILSLDTEFICRWDKYAAAEANRNLQNFEGRININTVITATAFDQEKYGL